MGIFDLFKSKSNSDHTRGFFHDLEERVALDRAALASLSPEELTAIIMKSRGLYGQGLSAERAGAFDRAKVLYREAADILPTNIEAIDNLAIQLMEESKFYDAVELLEQSVVADPSSPVAVRFLIKCYRELGRNRLALHAVQYFENNWPGESPFLDFSNLGKPRDPNENGAQIPPFKPGQVWTYRTRPVDPDSRVWVRLTEQYRDGIEVVHVSITNINMKNVDVPAFISHFPMNPDALRGSIIEEIGEQQTWAEGDDVYGEGYYLWLDEFEQGKAGAWTIPLHEAVQFTDDAQASHHEEQ